MCFELNVWSLKAPDTESFGLIADVSYISFGVTGLRSAENLGLFLADRMVEELMPFMSSSRSVRIGMPSSCLPLSFFGQTY